jgi:hypothetical protein
MIIEPFLERAFDFSVYLDIDGNGDTRLVGFQEVIVNGFCWSAVMPMTPRHEAEACTPRYMAVINEVCRALYQDGYTGPVCIDSMALAHGGVVPVVEVNARLSLGRMNHQLGTVLAAHRRHSYFSMLRTSLDRERIGELLNALAADRNLYGDSEDGIIPLSSNTLCARLKPGPGRLYFSVPFRNLFEVQRAISKLHSAIVRLGARVF